MEQDKSTGRDQERGSIGAMINADFRPGVKEP